jgi:3-hydroxyisobutyrate dehydrogenase-like beta-hydroxyacid dehydrogenase
MLKARVPLVLDKPDETWFGVELMHKDIRLALQAGDELAAALPSATIADEILTLAEELGYAHRDLAALHQVLARPSATAAR